MHAERRAWSCCAATTWRSRAPRPSSSAARDLVGKPISALLLAANATVTTCHSRTRDLAEVCRRADVLVAAVGVPELIKGDWVKEGAVVIDVGMNRTDGAHRRRRVRRRRASAPG